jgi:MutS domain V
LQHRLGNDLIGRECDLSLAIRGTTNRAAKRFVAALVTPPADRGTIYGSEWRHESPITIPESRYPIGERMEQTSQQAAADPRGEYSRRLARHEKAAAELERRHIRAGNIKLGIIVAGLAFAILILERLLSPYWILLPLAAFATFIVLHERILRAKSRAETAASIYRSGLARMDDKWAGTGATGGRFRDPKHVYAEDLDLFGRGCLFELLSTARLPMGEDRLASWLLKPSPVAEVIERQKTLADLRDKLDLREDIALTSEDLRPRMNAPALSAWVEGAPLLTNRALRYIFAALALAAVGAFIYIFVGEMIWPFAAILAFELLFYRSWHDRAEQVMSTLNCNAEGLTLFSRILERIEQELFASPHLRQRAAELKSQSASQAVRDLALVVYWADGREGMLAKALNLPLLYSLQAGFAADAWRIRWGKFVRNWMDTAAEIEALLSLASYSFEHPADPFPEFVPPETVRSQPGNDGGPAACEQTARDKRNPLSSRLATQNMHVAVPIFDGEELGHPLIPQKDCVRNSVRLDASTSVMLVSGSNMSGKSTLLRTVGINVVLAMAGAPVRARLLRLTPVALGTRIRSTDSLQEGRSNFYTEILHIRSVFELLNDGAPLLFLFDELLEGTNSKDRLIGAEGLMRALVERGAIGIVTTHDLALTTVTRSLGTAIRNFHFEDHVEDGRMRFDYKLRDGVVTRSNAIELMRLIGLRV